MKIALKIGGALAAMAMLTLSGQAQATTPNLVQNGTFASPGYGVSGLGYATADWSNLVESAVESGGSAAYGLPVISAGGQNLEVNADTFGDVVQTITGLTVGQSYLASWYYGNRPDSGPQLLNVTIGGTIDGTGIKPGTGLLLGTDAANGYQGWTLNRTEFTATSTSEVLSFAAYNTAIFGGVKFWGNEVTNVSVTAVPEPATWALMLVGFGMVGFALRKRSRAGDSSVSQLA